MFGSISEPEMALFRWHLMLGASLLLLLTGARADEPAWLNSLPEARHRAAKEDRIILVSFTGSDWCLSCRRQEKAVFQKDDFSAYAERNLVLLKVDFPRRSLAKDSSTPAARLKEQFEVTAFPTLIALDAEGRELGRWEGSSRGAAGRGVRRRELLRSPKLAAQ